MPLVKVSQKSPNDGYSQSMTNGVSTTFTSSCGPPHYRLSTRPEPLPPCANGSQLPDIRIENGCRVYQEVICGQATEKLMNGRRNDTAGPHL